MNFCARIGLSPLPATQEQLILFSAELSQSVAYSSMRTYLSAVRHLHISEGYEDPLKGTLRLSMLLQGARRAKPVKKDQRLPITPLILNKIYATLNQQPQRFDNKLLWAACCVGFFGFLRSGEFTTKQGEQFDPNSHLSIRDISLDSLANPQKVQIHLKRSKTDQWGHGFQVYLGRTDSHLCPVKALLTYVAARGFKEGPLFINRDGSPFSQQQLITSLRQALTQAGIDCTHYSGHSFRIGAATTASAKGIPETTIQALGRWRSDCYKRYIRPPQGELTSISAKLVQK